MNQLSCQDEITLNAVGQPDCSSGWVSIPSDNTSLALILDQLTAINDFSLTQVASLLAFWLLIFSIGFTTGTVVRILKKA